MRRSPKLVVSAGHYHTGHRLAPRLAQQKGWFAEGGLTDIELMCTGHDELTLEGIAKGSIDVGLDPRSDKALGAVAQGKPVCIVAGWRDNYEQLLFSRKDIHSVAELKGRRLGVHEGEGGIMTRQLRFALRRAGLDPDKDVQWVTLRDGLMDPGIALERLRKGESDIASVYPHFAQPFLDAGYPLLIDYRTWYPDGYPDRVVVSSPEVLEEKPEAVKAFLRGLIRGYRFVHQRRNFPASSAILRLIADEDKARGGQYAIEVEKNPLHEVFDEEAVEAQPFPLSGAPSLKGMAIVVQQEIDEGHLPVSFRSERALRLELVQQVAQELDARYGPRGYD